MATHGDIDVAALLAEVERLKAKNAELEKAKANAVTFKVSEKGCVSAYLGGRFPVSLYVDQWERLFSNLDTLKQFIEDNRDKLATLERKTTQNIK